MRDDGTGPQVSRRAIAILIGALIGPGSTGAQEGAAPIDPLWKIEPVRPDRRAATYFIPYGDAWSPGAIDVFPILVRPDAGDKELLLRLVMRDVAYSKKTPLQLTVDGESISLDLREAGRPQTNNSGCRRVVKVDLPGQEALARRLAAADVIEAGYGEGATRLSRTLSDDDRETIRHMVALYDMETAPSLVNDGRHHPPGPGSPDSDDTRVTYPEVIDKFPPEYPREALQRRLSGQVVIQAIVTRDGSVADPVVFQSSGSECGFEEAALEAVRQWTYVPGRVNGDPADIWFTIVVDFQLRRIDPHTKERLPKERSPRDPWHP